MEEQPSSTHCLFPTIDVTYVIHLEGNGRLDKVKEQLSRYRPSHTCIILFNKGYKKCNKPQLGKQMPPYDLIDANLHIMKHAKQHQYKTVLILEDDFFFDEEVSTCANEIDEFLLQRKDTAYCYYLGCVPCILFPSLTNHYRVIMRGASHSVVYSDAMMGKILTYDQKKITDWDIFLVYKHPSYTYYKPLCYQLFPETDNQKHWGEFNIFHSKIGAPTVKKVINLLKMDDQISPGYPFLYFIAKASFWIFLLILVALVYSIGVVVGRTKMIKRMKTGSPKILFSKR